MISKLEYHNETKSHFINQLGTHLYNKNISFASNPLLLTIMFMTFNQYAEIPEKEHEFFEAAYDVLYAQHDATKGLKRDRYTNLSSTDFKNILKNISTFSYLENKISFSNSNLNEYINLAKTLENQLFDEDSYKEDLVKSVCILIEDGLNYKYSHRKFQEFFTAKYIESANDLDKKNILKKIFEEKPVSINQDSVFSILFDINRSILERALLIEVLEEIKNKTEAETEEEKHFNYLKMLYSSIQLDYGMIGNLEEVEDEKDAISFTLVKDSEFLHEIIDFIKRKYKNHYKMPTKVNPIREDVGILKRYGIHDGYGCFSVKLDYVQIGSDLFDFIIRNSVLFIREYKYIMEVLEKIKISSVNSQSIKETLFKNKVNQVTS